MSEINKIIVSVNELADLFGVEPRTIQLWAEREEDPLPKIERGKYNFILCVKWRLNELEHEVKMLELSGDEKLHSLKVEEQILKNKKAEREYQRDLLELIERKPTLMIWTNQLNLIRSSIEQLRFSLIDELGTLFSDSDRGYEIINKNFDESLDSISSTQIESLIDNPEIIMEEVENNEEVQTISN